MEEFDSKLGLYSDNNLLTDKLSEKFNSKYVEVQVFKNFSKIDLSKISYLIINLLDDNYNTSELVKAAESVACKIIVLAPHRVDTNNYSKIDSLLNKLIETNLNLGVLLVPEIIGEAVKFNESYVSHNLIMQSLLSDRVKISDPKEIINLISMNKLADEVVKQTFSFGISGQKLLVSGYNKSVQDFIVSFLGIDKEDILNKNDDSGLTTIASTSKKEITLAVSSLISKTKKTLNTSKIIEPEVEILRPKVISNPLVQKKKVVFPLIKLLWPSLILVFFLVLPLLMIIVSAGSLYISAKVIENNSETSTKLIVASRQIATMANKINVGIPIYGEMSNFIVKIATISKELVNMTTVGKDLILKINGDDVFDVQTYADSMSASLDKIHTDINFLQGDIEGQNDYVGRKVRQILIIKNIELSAIKSEIYNLKNLTSRLSEMLGMTAPKKYLVLFQNNMELRPTGGFIGSFALITFEKGRMSQIVVNDVYSADGQLKGHVDPPEPIRRYLGEANWYLRDSNWDPNFKSSAIKAEWFLDKELDQKVDGVISIDLYLIQELLKITGPIYLADFNKTIDSSNLYLTTQSEVEDNFFPGSTKKASFLTALSRSLITEIENLDSKSYPAFFKALYKSLEAKHIQVYLHDAYANEAITGLGYDGGVDMNTVCGIRCVNDNYALVDANLGVNKSNLFIKRSQELNLSINKKYINHELFVTYENSAGTSIGPSGVYKSYTRVIVPNNATVAGVRIYEVNNTFKDLDYDKYDSDNGKEIGFWIQVNPSSVVKTQIVWTLPVESMDQGGELNLNIRKQSGTASDLLKINITEGDLTLTGKASSVYNTTLDKDFSQKMFVK